MKTTQFATKKALNSKTPMWAKNMFRITFVITSGITIFVAGTQLVDSNVKFEIALILKTIDALTLGFSKLFGEIEEN